MGLLTTWTNTNKQEDVALSSLYTMERDSAYGTLNTWWWKITRRRTKTYRYVGLTKAAAKSCVAAKQAQYLRRFWPWQFANGKWTQLQRPSDSYTEQVAEVTASHDEGEMWSVSISVDETCVAYVLGGSSESTINAETAVTNLCHTADWSYDE